MQKREMRDMTSFSIDITPLRDEIPHILLEVIADSDDRENAIKTAKEWFESAYESNIALFKIKEVKPVKTTQEAILIYPQNP